MRGIHYAKISFFSSSLKHYYWHKILNRQHLFPLFRRYHPHSQNTYSFYQTGLFLSVTNSTFSGMTLGQEKFGESVEATYKEYLAVVELLSALSYSSQLPCYFPCSLRIDHHCQSKDWEVKNTDSHVCSQNSYPTEV